MTTRYITTTLVLSRNLVRRFMRDKTALFFTFLFPLIFLLVFGTLNRGNQDLSFKVALVNHSETQFAEQFSDQLHKTSILKIDQSVDSIDKARDLMGKGELDSIIELPGSFGQPNQQGMPNGKAVVYYEESSPQAGQTLGGVMQQVLDGVNAKLLRQDRPFKVEQRSTKTNNLTAFDYVFAGLIGFSILSLGIFGLANGLPADKKTGILHRLRATPLRASQLILATALHYLSIGIVSIALMIVVGILIFDFHMRGNWFELGVFSVFSSLIMIGFGLAIGGWAKNENQSAPLSNLVSFPMMFLSGTFFPRFLMPEWLQNITSFLPLTPIVDGLRMIMTEGKGLLELGPQLAIMAVWTLVIYAIAIRAFRWE